MKKSFKGFTLIECIVALAVLAIASLTMAQIYASVSLRNRNNHLINSSLTNQMAYVEKYTDSEAKPFYFNSKTGTGGKLESVADPEADEDSTTKKPPHIQKDSIKSTATKPYVSIVSNYIPSGTKAGSTYSYSADIYILKSRNTSDSAVSDTDDSNLNLRYKYLIGHNN